MIVYVGSYVRIVPATTWSLVVWSCKYMALPYILDQVQPILGSTCVVCLQTSLIGAEILPTHWKLIG